MHTRCPRCYHWNLLPAHYPADRPLRPLCDGCGDPLPSTAYAHRYALCRVCLHRYAGDYAACPVCPAADDAALVLAWQERRFVGPVVAPTPLADRYCLDLWQSYEQEQAGKQKGSYSNGSSGGGPRNSSSGSYSNGSSNGRGRKDGPRPAPPAARAPAAVLVPSAPAADAVAFLPSGPIALFDLEAAALPANANGDTPAPTAPIRSDEGLSGVEYELISDAARLHEVVDLLSAEPVLGVDTETDGLDPYTTRLLLLQVATPHKAYIVDCQRVDPLPFKAILESGRSLKLLQNAKFDYKILKQIAGIELCNVFDTMLAERLLTAGRAREISLRQIALKYCGIVMDKTIRKSFVGVRGDGYLSEEQLTYAARDALILFEIQRLQSAELKKLRMGQVAELEFQCVAAVGDMELAGVKIDTAKWREILRRVTIERDRSAEELNEIVATVARQSTMFGVPTINLNSGQQIIETFGRLGVELSDTSEATLTKAGDHPAIKKLLEYRSHEKTLSAFGEHLLEMINAQTGRLHPNFQQYGADTGRFSCTDPNVQQIPATSDFRACFVAAEGYKLVTCVAEGTRVACERGLIPIEAVMIGDRVLQEDGSLQYVARVIDQGVRETVTLKTGMGYEITVTPEHRIRVVDSSGEYVWRAICDLQPADQVALKLGLPALTGSPLPILPGLYYNHFNAVNHPLPAILSAELALLLGYITGDGTFAVDYVGFVVAAKDTDLAQYLLGLCESLFAYHPKPLAYRGVYDIRLYSKQIKQWLQQVGSAKDHVPNLLWTAGPDMIAAYLRGLFEADGSVQGSSTGRVSFSTVHERLAREVQELLALLGIAAVRSKIEHGKGCGYIWMLTIPAAWKGTFHKAVGFVSARKQQSLLELLAVPSGKNGHGGLPNMQAKVTKILKTTELPARPGSLLRNIRSRTSRLSTGTVTLLREQYPLVFDQLGIDTLVDCSLLCDKVVSVEQSIPQRVYDLTVTDTSTFITGGFINHNCDYSQAELRILAELSGDPAFVEAFQGGGDLHAITASQMFQVDLDQVTKTQRSAAKSINFGLAYGRGPGSLALQLGVSPDEAKALIEKYFQAYTGIQQWLDKAARDAVRKGYSDTPLGRRRFYDVPNRDDPEYRSKIGSIERQGKNTPIQGSNADMTKIALVFLRTALQGFDARVVNTVHDEIVVEVRADQAEAVKEIVEHEMVRAGEQILQKVPIVADAAIGDYWKK
ncbi:MAG: DNA polymerase [Chloroflexota bacterium]|nr:DNA polymerase [Chloroflexota bacterium]